MHHILVVEDDKILRNNIIEFLESEGFSTSSAMDGEDALSEIKDITPDLILCDIMMPKMNGIELSDFLHKQESFNTVPFIFLTAKADPSDIRKGMNAGADDYIIKPFNFDDLLKSINKRLLKKEIFNKRYEEVTESITKHLPHELRTPLFAVNGLSEMLLEELEHLSKDEIFNIVKNIKSSGERISERLEKFLLYAELNIISNSKSFYHNLKNDKTYVEQDIVTRLINRVAENKNRINDIEIGAIPECTLFMYNSYFNFIVNELIDNALKFSKEGTTINVKGSLRENYFTLSIEDNGCGLKQEEIENIRAFKQFNKNDMLQEGLGFGLTIIQKIVELYDCYLLIRSMPGESTQIDVSFKLNKSN
mgnify:CR=1 FL=1